MPLTPTPGADALAAGIPLVPGTGLRTDVDEYINRLADELARRTMAVMAITKGGTGATTAAAALANLGALPRSEVYDGTGSVFSKVPRYDAGGRLIAAAPVADNHAVPLGTMNLAFGNALMRYGGILDQGRLTVQGAGEIFMTNLSNVTSGFVAMYRNGDGRVGISPSARRFKRDIKDHPYTIEQLRAIRVVSYRLKAGVYGEGWEDQPGDVGVIAEELIDAGLSEFVVFDDEGAPLSVHYERLALVAIGAVQELVDAHDALEARVLALEAR
ncbi:tail fiber domain-containing protein [Microbacterium maritypicum]